MSSYILTQDILTTAEPELVFNTNYTCCIKAFNIVNISDAEATYSIYVNPTGTEYTLDNIFHYNVSIDKGSSYYLELGQGGFVLTPKGSIAGASSPAGSCHLTILGGKVS